MRGLLPALCLALALVSAPAAWAEAPELEGAWHVLVHYTDSATNKPEQPRWEDRLWVFSREGDRLRWVEYPIVAFDDASGRFERLGTNRASRVLHYWEPSAGQLADIRNGLQYNPRGSRRKSLKGSPAKGWSSGSGAAYQSARFITYAEVWEVSAGATPRFRIQGVMGGAMAESLEGVTLYETESVDAGGDVLRGRFERDGTRVGTFRMTRSGAPAKVKGSGKTDGERVQELFFGEMASQLFRSQEVGDLDATLQEQAAAGTLPPEIRQEVRTRMEAAIEEQYRAQGNDPRKYRPQILSLARKMERLYLDEGRSTEELSQMLRTGELRP